LERSDRWVDVTELYEMAETLSDQKLIKEHDPDLRDIFFQQYASGAEITKLLNEWSDAADAVLIDIHQQMTRPVKIAPPDKPLTYVANLKELLAILKKYLTVYLGVRRYDPTEPMPERFRFDGIEARDLIAKLNSVEETCAGLARTSIA